MYFESWCISFLSLIRSIVKKKKKVLNFISSLELGSECSQF